MTITFSLLVHTHLLLTMGLTLSLLPSPLYFVASLLRAIILVASLFNPMILVGSRLILVGSRLRALEPGYPNFVISLSDNTCLVMMEHIWIQFPSMFLFQHFVCYFILWPYRTISSEIITSRLVQKKSVDFVTSLMFNTSTFRMRFVVVHRP